MAAPASRDRSKTSGRADAGSTAAPASSASRASRRSPGSPPTLFIPSWELYSVMNVALGDWGTPGRAAPSWTEEEVMMYVDSYTVWQLQPS
jgi:hypothetical protein